jgi:molybdopterin-guanine dinucleotide biosynthesis protein
VAQIGSVIGRGFSYKLLKAVAGMDDAPLEAALEKLSDTDIVLVEGVLNAARHSASTASCCTSTTWTVAPTS